MAAKASTAGKIKNMAGMWGKARESVKNDSGDLIPVEKGTYEMQIVGCEAGTWGDARKVWLKHAVVSGESGGEDARGKICSSFEAIDSEEKMVWLMRLLTAYGVDLDAVNCEDEDDLLKIFQELIDNQACARVAVTEKDGWLNLRVRGLVDVDDDQKFDPVAVLKAAGKGKGAAGGGGKKGGADRGERSAPKQEEAAAEEDSFSEGDRVKGKRNGKVAEGYIESFDKDDNPMVVFDGEKKAVKCDLEALEKVAEDSGADEHKDAAEGEGDFDPMKVKTGDRVLVDDGGDDCVPGEVVSAPPPKPDGSGKVRIKLDSGATKLYERSAIMNRAEEASSAPEIKVGDKVLVKWAGKDQAGTVTAVGEKVKVKLNKGGAVVSVPPDDVMYDVDK